jgi:hypothetical protein
MQNIKPPTIVDYEVELDDSSITVDWSDGKVEAVSPETVLAWLSAGQQALAAQAAAAQPEQTWTFVGHWENDRIVVEYILNGEQVDPREDTGYWEQGLFAEAESGFTQEDALDKLRAKYEEDDNAHGEDRTEVVESAPVQVAEHFHPGEYYGCREDHRQDHRI